MKRTIWTAAIAVGLVIGAPVAAHAEGEPSSSPQPPVTESEAVPSVTTPEHPEAPTSSDPTSAASSDEPVEGTDNSSTPDPLIDVTPQIEPEPAEGEVGEPSVIVLQSWFMPGSTGEITWPQRLIQPGDTGFCQTDDQYEVGTPEKRAIYDALIAGTVLNSPADDAAIYVGGGFAAPCSMPPIDVPGDTTPDEPLPGEPEQPVVTPPAEVVPVQPVVTAAVQPIAPLKVQRLADTGFNDAANDAAGWSLFWASVLTLGGLGIIIPSAIRQRRNNAAE